jgi:hypothetical protein
MPDTYPDAQRGTIAGGSGRYVDGTETLRLTVFNAAASVAVALAGRVLVDDGRIVPFVHRLVPTTDRVATVFDVALPCGFLLGASARIIGGAPLDGQAYGVLSLGYGGAAQFTELEVLAAGTITAARRLAWPGSPVLGPLDSPGALRSITGTTPAVASEISETVPTGARWQLLALHFRLVTDANVANRLPVLIVDDGANILYRRSTISNHPASATFFYSAGPGGADTTTANNNAVAFNLPVPLDLPAGARIRTSTTAIQAGDQYGLVQYLVRERIEGA